jgi:MinD superfamily P-loop ATPase
VWAVGPPYVAAVTADRPVFPAGLELNGRPGAPVRPGPRRPHVDKRLCNLCGECVRGCPTNRHVIARGEAQLKPFCSGCGVCEDACPQAAIQMVLPWRAVEGQG